MPSHPEPDPRREDAAARPSRPPAPRPIPGASDRAPGDALLVFETGNGRVRRCDCCDTLRVHLGNAMLAVDADGFGQLLENVAAFDRGDTPLGPWPADRALLHVGDSGVALVFTTDEIAELHRLLAGARLMLDLAPPTDD
jgi:hypothetical protein